MQITGRCTCMVLFFTGLQLAAQVTPAAQLFGADSWLQYKRAFALQPGYTATVTPHPDKWLTHPHPGPEGGWCGAGGNGVRDRSGHIEGSLVVWRGDFSEHPDDPFIPSPIAWFAADTQTLTFTKPGVYYLGPEDDQWKDNQGTINVDIDITSDLLRQIKKATGPK